MAQQNSIKLACQLTFKQNLYVYLINILSYLIYIFRAQPILSKLKMATKTDNTASYMELVDKGLEFLPFWNLVSII